jgi:Holliday junction DNA helicase RuvA
VIAFLTGRLAAKDEAGCAIDVAGVGYRLSMSTNSIAALPAEGDDVTVFTYLHVREDELSLFGFESEQERSAFTQLIGVSGVGPKVALAVLSAFSPDVLARAVSSDDTGLISSVPGIGKKTAERLCLELRDKLGTGGAVAAGARTGQAEEVTNALLGMGFSAAEVSVALAGVDAADAETLLREALRRLGGRG